MLGAMPQLDPGCPDRVVASQEPHALTPNLEPELQQVLEAITLEYAISIY